MHNHPGQEYAKPSEQDGEVTFRLRRAGDLLGIELADHIVFGQKRFYSFQEHHRLYC